MVSRYTREPAPSEWAKTQNSLGNALQVLGERESGNERLEEAVPVCEAALEERTRDHVPFEWARAQNNLGNALWALAERENGTAELEKAVIVFRAALEIRTHDCEPLDWALTRVISGMYSGVSESGSALWPCWCNLARDQKVLILIVRGDPLPQAAVVLARRVLARRSETSN
ncbi:tetratricopeptide repeat protein [Tunturibacter psychrotolerans]|uniref:Tetratricopeptide repeat protein n=1 Tax=Tunturiibacter psychrotolerans TaxID=3069686 RepID=A0AAU7ZK25_9BACT